MQYSLCMVTNRRGIADGTKLVVRGIHSRVIDAEIATGNREAASFHSQMVFDTF